MNRMERTGWNGLGRLAVAGLLFVIALAFSGTVPDPAVAATRSCSALASSGVVFSSYDSVNKLAVNGVDTITFTCLGTGSDTLNIVIRGGNANACSPRQMRSGTAALAYNLYSDAAFASVWCDGGLRLDVPIAFPASGIVTRSVTVYGRVTAAQTPTYGTYTDLLSIDLKDRGATLLTSTLPVSSGVNAMCSVSVSPLAFGAYNKASASTSTASLSVTCSNGAPYQVSLGAGQYLGPGIRRLMGPGSAYLDYELHRDLARTVSWGTGTLLGGVLGATGSGTAQTVPIYGRIPAGQNSPVGSYNDSVMVTVEY